MPKLLDGGPWLQTLGHRLRIAYFLKNDTLTSALMQDGVMVSPHLPLNLDFLSPRGESYHHRELGNP